MSDWVHDCAYTNDVVTGCTVRLAYPATVSERGPRVSKSLQGTQEPEAQYWAKNEGQVQKLHRSVE